MMPTLRVGSVPYLVGRPLDSGLGGEPGIDLSYDVPTRLVQRLRAGDLDVALVSAVELFRRPGYRYLDGLGVVGKGFVGSVQVFLRRPVEALGSVALDPSSRAAAALVRVLLAARPQGPPEFLEPPSGVDPRSIEADAWLRIGDPALREYLAPDAPPVFNPSQAWTERTGLPYVFAAWIVGAGVDIEPFAAAFLRARARGTERLGELAERASREWNLPLEDCRRYLTAECGYEPGEELGPALAAFQGAASALDLCRGDLAPEPVPLPGPLPGALSRAVPGTPCPG